MIIKSALFFLRVIDFVWDSYDLLSQLTKKVTIKRSQGRSVVDLSKASYSIVSE